MDQGGAFNIQGERLLISCSASSITYVVANFNNRLPTPLDGSWEVLTVSGTEADVELPTHIYFERNRKWMCVFRYEDSWDVHHFEVSTESKSIRIWENWINKGPIVFSGNYELDNNTLVLNGRLNEAQFEVRLEGVK